MIDQLLSFWAQRSKHEQFLLLLIPLIVAGGVGLLLKLSSSEDNVTLFSNLSEQDSGEIVEMLRQEKVDYVLESGGTRILVPQSHVLDLRVSLAKKGFPKGGSIGFEVFDKTSMSDTESIKQIKYQRALEGELSRTITAFDYVQAARVHIAKPEESLFKSEQKPVTAAVVIQMKTGRQLNGSQIGGIRNLVAAAVEGLSPDRISIVDQSGRLLATAGGDGDNQLADTMDDQRHDFEKRLAQRIEEILAPVAGHGKVVARVSADIDFRKIEKTEEKYDPDPVVRSEKRTEEKSQRQESVSGGIPGAQSNLPGQAGVPINGEGSGSTRNQETLTYEIGKIVSHSVEPISTIKRLSVAVLIDNKRNEVAGKTESSAWTNDEIGKFEQLIKNAVGFDSTRGDQVVVQNIAFELPEPIGELTKVEKVRNFLAAYNLSPIKMISAFFVVTMLFSFLFIVNKPLKVMLNDIVTVMQTTPQQTYATGSTAVSALGPGETTNDPSADPNDPRAAVKRMAIRNPDVAVQVIKGWLKER